MTTTAPYLIRLAIVGIAVLSALAIPCQFTDSTGKSYDLRPLVAENKTGYVWEQEVWNINSYSLDSLSSDDQVKVTFQLQVCDNVMSPNFPCNETGAVYSFGPDKSCLSWGNAKVAMFDVTPYKDGIMLQLYHGSSVSHWGRYSANIYFVCDASKTMSTPTFEHVKVPDNQAHFKIFTKYAC